MLPATSAGAPLAGRISAAGVATRVRLNKTEAVKQALEHELQRLDAQMPLRERLKPLQDRVLARPPTGQDADKAFYDELSGEP
jgi:antitoxin VapB